MKSIDELVGEAPAVLMLRLIVGTQRWSKWLLLLCPVSLLATAKFLIGRKQRDKEAVFLFCVVAIKPQSCNRRFDAPWPSACCCSGVLALVIEVAMEESMLSVREPTQRM